MNNEVIKVIGPAGPLVDQIRWLPWFFSKYHNFASLFSFSRYGIHLINVRSIIVAVYFRKY